MNRSHRRGAVALALALIQGVAAAAAAPEAAQELARKSGLWTQLDLLGAQVRSGMVAAMGRSQVTLSDERRSAVLACVDQAYAPEALRASATDAVAGALQPADVAPIDAWYDSDLGRRISTIESTSSKRTPDPEERLRRGADALTTASAARKASLQSIIVETHSVDMMTDTLIEMALAVQQGMATLDPASTPDSLARIRSDLSGRRPQLVDHFAQVSLPAYAFTYAELGDDDVRRYAEHLATPAARDFDDGTTRGVSRSMTSASVNLARCLKASATPPAP